MKVRKLINSLIEMCAQNGVSIDDVDVLIRRDDDSDAFQLNQVEEDLFDADTNEVLETIVVKHRANGSCAEGPDQFDHLGSTNDKLLRSSIQNAEFRDRLFELGESPADMMKLEDVYNDGLIGAAPELLEALKEAKDLLAGLPADLANARLIAAAPDMLAALKEVAEWAGKETAQLDHMADAMVALLLAREAIAKAEGAPA